jgi:hypothetical protein
MQNRFLYVTIIILSFISVSASGQKMVNSPFSRFNIGTLEPAGSFRSLGMGGIGMAIKDNTSVFYSNPASYSSLDTTSFLFDFGLDYSLNKISSGGQKYSSDDMNFDHLILAFPLSKGIGFAAGILPLSNGYYNLSESVTQNDPGYDPVTGGYSTLHTGEGGFTNFFLGSGFRLNKNFSAGFNLNLLLGQVNRLNEFNFEDFYNVYNNNSTEKLQLNGINFDYGLQYTTSIKKDYFFNAGVTLSAGKNYHSKYENLSYRYTAYGINDTLTYIFEDSTKTFLPGSFKAGIAIGRKDKFIIGVDYVTTKWDKAKIPGAQGYLGNTSNVLFGAGYIPGKFDNFSYLKRVEYRIGGHIGNNYLVLDGHQIKEIGISAGLGLPMRGVLSKTNLFLDYTKKTGSLTNITHVENFYTFGISLNFYDAFWFIKRKYD